MSSMLDVALTCARKGFRVFPLRPNAKTPLLADWPRLATCDEATIREWWSGEFETTSKKGSTFKIPANSNVGICPGEDFVIIDIDTKPGGNGAAEFRRLVEEGMPKTFTVRTPSGGLHAYYVHPRKTGLQVEGVSTDYVKSVAGWRRDGSGVDIRGNSGQGVAPGSMIDGMPYTVQLPIEPAMLPEAIARQLPYRAARANPDFDLRDIPSYLKERTAVHDTSMEVTGRSKFSEFPDRIPQGKRDQTLFSYACSWRERGYPIDHARALMKELVAKCDHSEDPISIDEAQEKVTRAYDTYTPSKPQDWTTLVGGDTSIEAPKRQVEDLKAALDRFIFIEDGDRVADTCRHPAFGVLKLSEFKNSYRNITLEYTPDGTTRPKKVPLPDVWLASKFRRTVRGVGYQPEPPKKSHDRVFNYMGEEFYNLWSGSNVSLPEVYDPSKAEPFFEHLRYVFGQDREALNHFTDWLSYTVQFPHVRIKHAVLLVGKPGIGKGFIYETMEKLLGEKNVSVVGNHDLESAFNTWVSQVVLAVVDDVINHRSGPMWDRVKSEITENEIEINRKYGGKGKERVFANILMFSNHMDAIATALDDRRLWVHTTSVDRRGDAYYVRLFRWLESDGPSHLLHALLHRDLSRFNHGALPALTASKRRMYEANQTVIEQLIYDGIDEKEGCFTADIVCPALVEQFVLTRVSTDHLDQKDQHYIRRILANMTDHLPQDRYRVPGKVGQLRLKCIRNWLKWGAATADEVVDEYVKARDASIARPTLVSIGGGSK